MRTGPKPLHPIALLAAAALLLGAPAPSSGASRPDTAGPARHPVGRRMFAGPGCSARIAVPTVAYDLGRSFAGLPASQARPTCFPAQRDKQQVWSGPVVAYAGLALSYGTCDASEAPCTPPLEVQNWPQCAHNPRSYEPNPWIHPKTRQEREEAGGIGDLRVRLPEAPWVPVFDLEGGRRIEIFAGATAVVVFANEASMRRRAADALVRLIARYYPRGRRAVLDAALRDPGDGSACRVRRGTL